jgi:hypothetical protein
MRMSQATFKKLAFKMIQAKEMSRLSCLVVSICGIPSQKGERQLDVLEAVTELYASWNERFVWNRFLLERFLARGAEFLRYCLPLIHGAVFIRQCSINGRLFRWSLVSRRSNRRAGRVAGLILNPQITLHVVFGSRHYLSKLYLVPNGKCQSQIKLHIASSHQALGISSAAATTPATAPTLSRPSRSWSIRTALPPSSSLGDRSRFSGASSRPSKTTSQTSSSARKRTTTKALEATLGTRFDKLKLEQNLSNLSKQNFSNLSNLKVMLKLHLPLTNGFSGIKTPTCLNALCREIKDYFTSSVNLHCCLFDQA